MAKKILIVDDDEGIRSIASIVLTREGFHPLTAETCERAIELARQESPDLIIMDAQFLHSEIQGVEACTILKGDERTRNIPVIGSSSPNAYEEDFERAGASDYLSKFYTPEQLIRKVTQYVGGQ